jgi:glycosyltransferase involved in cell wall biosynthesis
MDDLLPNIDKQKDIKKRYQETPETKIISIIGRLELVKGHRYFVEAAHRILQSNNNDVKFLIIGEGEQRGKIEKDTKSLGLEKHIIFTGFKKNIIDYLAITDILIISSLYEGIPYTLLEAMALGKCVVATDVGGLKEVIQSEINGVLVKKEDANAIAMAVNLLLHDDHKREMLGKFARERVSNYYSSRVIVKEIINLYNKVIK